MSAWLLSLIAIVLMAVALTSGFRRGFRQQMPRLIGLLFGCVCAHIFRDPVQYRLMSLLPYDLGKVESEFVYSTFSCGLVFVAFYFVFSFATRIIALLFRKGAHGLFDSMGGAVLSLVIYMTFLSLAYNMMICMRPRSPLTQSLQHSDANIISEVLLLAPALLGSQSPEELAHLQQLDDASRISI